MLNNDEDEPPKEKAGTLLVDPAVIDDVDAKPEKLNL